MYPLYNKLRTHGNPIHPTFALSVQMKKLQCDRTVLITGIPDIKDEETLRDLLEIHFQLDTNGGGEVQKLFYCPEGKNTIVLFENDEDDFPQKE